MIQAFLSYTIVGIVAGCIYAMLASGLVVTYTTSGIFNFAHGAIGMIAAFTYWQLHIDWGWPPYLALPLVLLVIAPAIGAIIERVLIRPLRGADVDVTLVTTMGLLLLLVGIAQTIWNPTVGRNLPEFFFGQSIHLPGVNVTYNQLTVVAVAGLLAVGLRYLFGYTRTGIAMRAVVDDPDLLAMSGAKPAQIQQLSWALGAGLAGLAGILLAPLVTLDSLLLTLLVINGYAAAMAGRLKSLTLTAVGALGLGLAINYDVGYQVQKGFFSFTATYGSVIPAALFFIVLIALPQERLRVGSVLRPSVPRVPGLRQSLVVAIALVVAAGIAVTLLSGSNLTVAAKAFALAIILLSLVLLTGYSGQASLCQFTFVGLGAYAMGNFGKGGNLFGLLAAIVIPAIVGALLALPTLKLRGLYLALATFAFAGAMDAVFFNKRLGASGSLTVDRPRIPGFGTLSDEAFVILLAVIFAALAVGVLALRRGPVGRRLSALNDSPAACATLGVNINITKLAVFAGAAGLAGLGGALFGGVQTNISAGDVSSLNSVVLLLLVRIGGVNTVTGAFLGALQFALFPVIQPHIPIDGNISFLLTGLGAIAVGQAPNGLGGRIADAGTKLRRFLDTQPLGRPVLTAVGAR